MPLSVSIDHPAASSAVPAPASICDSTPEPETPCNPGKYRPLETPNIFPALRSAVIHGSTFIHTSASPTSKGQCRVLISSPLADTNSLIMQWILEAIKESEDVLWLYGSAGAGKSAIAQSIAEKCAKLNLLVASFFFSRASPSRNNEKFLIASIAYQLAISIPVTRSYIESAIQIDPAVFDRSLDTQIETLIIQPLENAYAVVNPADAKQWPRLIIIDGLDECHDPLIQRSIIHVLSAALLRITFPILLVASRPEPHIRHAFNTLNKSHASRHIVLDDS